MEDCLRIITSLLPLKEQLVLRLVCREFSQLIVVDGIFNVRRAGFYGFAKGIHLSNQVRVKDQVVAPNTEELDLCSWKKQGLPSSLFLKEFTSLRVQTHRDLSSFSNLRRLEIHAYDVGGDSSLCLRTRPPHLEHFILRDVTCFTLTFPVRRLEAYAKKSCASIRLDVSFVIELETDIEFVSLHKKEKKTSSLRVVQLGKSTQISACPKEAFSRVTHYAGPPANSTKFFEFPVVQEATFYLIGHLKHTDGWYSSEFFNCRVTDLSRFQHMKKLTLSTWTHANVLRMDRASFNAPLLEDLTIDMSMYDDFSIDCPLKRLSLQVYVNLMRIKGLPPKMEAISLRHSQLGVLVDLTEVDLLKINHGLLFVGQLEEFCKRVSVRKLEYL